MRLRRRRTIWQRTADTLGGVAAAARGHVSSTPAVRNGLLAAGAVAGLAAGSAAVSSHRRGDGSADAS